MRKIRLIIGFFVIGIVMIYISGCCWKRKTVERNYIDNQTLCGATAWRFVESEPMKISGYYLKDTLVSDTNITFNRELIFSCDGYWYIFMLDKIFMQRNDSSCFCWNADYNPKGNCLHPGSNFKKENFKYWTEDNGKILVLQACGYPSQNDTVPRLFQMRFKANLYMKKKPCRCYDIGTLYLSPINQEAVLFTKNATTDTTATKVELFLVNQDCLE